MLKIVKGRRVEPKAEGLTDGVKPRRNLWRPSTEADPPGVQVVVSVWNCEAWLDRFFHSLERALQGYRWIFVASDDASTDGSWDKLQEYAKRASAQQCVLKRQTEKAANVSVAKNRAVRMGLPFRETHPAMMLCDADDEAGSYRVRGLLGAALRDGHLSLAGDFERERDGQRIYHNGAALTYGPPMTLFHEALVPWDGTLFDESFHNHGDWAQQAEWRARGIHTEIVPGFVTNVHVYHPNSVSNNLTPADVAERAEKLKRYKEWLSRRVLISFCTSCMGRLHHLKQTLPANMELCREMGDVEFCLANYNSRDGLDEWVTAELGGALASGRLKYVRTTKPEEFNMSHAKNMAHGLATGMFVVNVDADNFLTKEYIEALRAEIATGGEVIHFPSEKQSWGGGFGRVAVRRDLFFSIGGYDEEHKGWGAEDWDLVQRAGKMSRRPIRLLDAQVLKCIEHDDAERLANMPVKDKHENNRVWHQYFAERLDRGEYVVNGGRAIGEA